MFYFLLGFVCGILAGQELSIPKLKPHIIKTYAKLFPKDADNVEPKKDE